MREVHLYVEGGGQGANGKASFRRGMKRLLEKAGVQGRVKVIACGGRHDTFRAFQREVGGAAGARAMLLVDAEECVGAASTRTEHLRRADGWSNLAEEQCHLMVVVMETWLVADPGTLAEYYKHQFRSNCLPAREDLEQVSKTEIEDALKVATRDTVKGSYHKIKHGPALLELVDPVAIRRRARHFCLLVDELKHLTG